MSISDSKKDRKETIIIASACITLLSGIVMSFLSFFLSLDHSIHTSVLWYFAQTLMYTASAFGIYGYVKAQSDKINNLLHNATK